MSPHSNRILASDRGFIIRVSGAMIGRSDAIQQPRNGDGDVNKKAGRDVPPYPIAYFHTRCSCIDLSTVLAEFRRACVLSETLMFQSSTNGHKSQQDFLVFVLFSSIVARLGRSFLTPSSRR